MNSILEFIISSYLKQIASLESTISTIEIFQQKCPQLDRKFINVDNGVSPCAHYYSDKLFVKPSIADIAGDVTMEGKRSLADLNIPMNILSLVPSDLLVLMVVPKTGMKWLDKVVIAATVAPQV